jgi:uncharacterized protein (TIGR02145 family)
VNLLINFLFLQCLKLWIKRELMRKHLFLLLSFMLTGMMLFAQTYITLTFTGQDQNGDHVRLDNVVIQNLTREWSTTIFYPDTFYMLMISTDINGFEQENGTQVMPNPFEGRTRLNLYSGQGESVNMMIIDVSGKEYVEYQGDLSQGNNFFEISLTTPQTYILSVQTNSRIWNVKMVNTGWAATNSISLVGGETNVTKVKLDGAKSNIFVLGDEMRYTAYSTQNDEVISSTLVTQQQSASEEIVFYFDVPVVVELPTVTTEMASNVTANAATTGGNVLSDGGAMVTARGVCYGVNPNPTLSDDFTVDGTGTGTFTSNLTNLVENTTYYARAYATNSAGTAYGNEETFTTYNSCPGAATVMDYDSNTYNTILIGNQCWMRENLRTTHYADGVSIPMGSIYGDSTLSTTSPYYYDYSLSHVVLSQRGYLYNWPAIMHGSNSSSANPSGVQGVCPTGWHVPSDAEWTQLTNYVSSQSQYVCGGNNSNIAKALASKTWWNSSTPTTCAVGCMPNNNNATGFSIVPTGQVMNSNWGWNGTAHYWSSTSSNSIYAYYRILYYNSSEVNRNDISKEKGYAVRCLRD